MDNIFYMLCKFKQDKNVKKQLFDVRKNILK